jgi:hypothetical protein
MPEYITGVRWTEARATADADDPDAVAFDSCALAVPAADADVPDAVSAAETSQATDAPRATQAAANPMTLFICFPPVNSYMKARPPQAPLLSGRPSLATDLSGPAIRRPNISGQ